MNQVNESDGSDTRTALLELAAIDSLRGSPVIDLDDSLRYDPEYLEIRCGFDEAATALAFTVPEAEPPAGLLDRLMASIADVPQAEAPPQGYLEVKPGVTGVRTNDASWMDAPVPGASYKLIARDPERHYTTRLVRFAPGTSYPTHRHGGTEEIFVLEGSVSVNGVTLKAGDYCRSEAGTEEFGTFSGDGALAIVVSSDFDEIGA